MQYLVVFKVEFARKFDEASVTYKAIRMPNSMLVLDVLGLGDHEATREALFLVSTRLADVLTIDRVVRVDQQLDITPTTSKVFRMIDTAVHVLHSTGRHGLVANSTKNHDQQQTLNKVTQQQKIVERGAKGGD
jgi:hypothetical protein